jgi:hypothetical protein
LSMSARDIGAKPSPGASQGGRLVSVF